jgi:hypothetical protein
MTESLTPEEEQQLKEAALIMRLKDFNRVKEYLRSKNIPFTDGADLIKVADMTVSKEFKVTFGSDREYQYSFEKLLQKIHFSIDDKAKAAVAFSPPVPNTADGNIKLVPGLVIKGDNFTLIKKIETLDEFWKVINTDKSFFARHRMYPTAFFFSWQIKNIAWWIKAGFFWTTKQNN